MGALLGAVVLAVVGYITAESVLMAYSHVWHWLAAGIDGVAGYMGGQWLGRRAARWRAGA